MQFNRHDAVSSPAFFVCLFILVFFNSVPRYDKRKTSKRRRQRGAVRDFMQETLNVAHIWSDSIITIVYVALLSAGARHIVFSEAFGRR